MKKTLLILCMAGMLLSCTSCGGKKQEETSMEESTQIQVALTEIRDAVKEAYGENYLPQMEYDAEMFENTFGITKDLYDEFLAEAPMISAQVDVFVAVKAKEGKEEEVKQLLETYCDDVLNNSLQYPMNLGKIEGATIYQNGSYIFYLILGAYPDGQEEVDAEMAKEQNQIAVDTIEGILGKADQ